MNDFLSEDLYHDGYQARKSGLTLSDWPRGLSKDHLDQWRTGWKDADHDIIYTTKERNETA